MRKEKCVIYARYSPRPKDKLPGETIEMQISKCRHYAAARDMEVIGIFQDEGVSGGAPIRKEFEKAMQLCMDHGGTLLVYSITRFGRSLEQTLYHHRRLKDAGSDLASVKEVIDTTTASGRLMFAIQSAMAEFYREQVSEATRDALQNRKEKGMYCGGKLPYGKKLDRDGKTLKPDPAEQVVISRVKYLREVEGLTLRELAVQLNDEGYATRSGGPWNKNSVHTVVKCEE